jgi:hypothetical protein
MWSRRKRGKTRGRGRYLIAGLVRLSAISIRKAQCADYRDGRDRRNRDKQKPQRVLPLLFWGAHNPLILRHFLGVFRFAQMALANVRTLTISSRNKYL